MNFNNRVICLLLGVVVLGVATNTADAFRPVNQNLPERVQEVGQDPQSAFTSVKEVSDLTIAVPTVVDVPIERGIYERNSFLVLENETGRYIGSYFRQSQVPVEQRVTATTLPFQVTSRYLTDDSLDTDINFSVNGEDVSRVTVTLSAQTPITASVLTTKLATHVALPLTVAVRALGADGPTTVLTETRMTSGRVTFPETTADQFEVTYSHIQPLRIAEISLEPNTPNRVIDNSLRFLAQPGMSYRIFIDADRSISALKTEAGDLRSNIDILELPFVPTVGNQLYVPADIDFDGVPDAADNCVSEANPDQLDINVNGKGDVCEDFDRDGRLNSVDNCPNTPNRSQADEDGDGIGDVCDEEESRFTERNAWVPWAGIGIAFVVLGCLFMIVLRSPRPEEEVTEALSEDQTEPPVQ